MAARANAAPRMQRRKSRIEPPLYLTAISRKKMALILGIADQRGEQDQSGIPVRLEEFQAQVWIVDVEALDLPAKMRAEEDTADREHHPRSGRNAGQADQHYGHRVETDQGEPGPFAEQTRRRFDADQSVVLAVLMRVDGIVADYPGDRADV